MGTAEGMKGLESEGWRVLAHGRGMLRLESSVASSVAAMVERLCHRLIRPARRVSLPPISVIR